MAVGVFLNQLSRPVFRARAREASERWSLGDWVGEREPARTNETGFSPDRNLPPDKRGTPPCRSGQLKKDLGLEVSSVKDVARLISEIMRLSFFVDSSSSSPLGTKRILTRRMMKCGLSLADSGLQLGLESRKAVSQRKFSLTGQAQPG